MSKIDEWTTDDGLTLLEGWARDGLTEEQIANNIGIGRTTLYEWRKKEPNIENALKRGRDVVDYEVENALYKNAINGNVTAQIFWLKNRRGNTWREKQEAIVHNEIENLNTLADMLGFNKEVKEDEKTSVVEDDIE